MHGSELVGESAFGPGLQAALVALTARNPISRRAMTELLCELFGVGISVGASDRICQRTACVLAGPHARLTSQVLGSGALNVRWFLEGENRWMWTAASAEGAIFRIAPDRHQDRLSELLGPDFQGIVSSDRWWAYNLLEPEQRQACWSPLVRLQIPQRGIGRPRRVRDRRPGAQRPAVRSLARIPRASRPRAADRRDDTRPGRATRPARTRRHEVQAPPSAPRVREEPDQDLACAVDVHDDPRRDTDDNAAERALRGPVIHRRLSHGNQSDDGERFTERALSASITCRLQHHSLFAYLRQLLTANQTGGALPALL